MKERQAIRDRERERESRLRFYAIMYTVERRDRHRADYVSKL